jgi:hypothetical protein
MHSCALDAELARLRRPSVGAPPADGCRKGRSSMPEEVKLTEEDVALLVEAAKIVMALAVKRRVLLEEGEVAAKLFDAFLSGERDPERLAAIVLRDGDATVH